MLILSSRDAARRGGFWIIPAVGIIAVLVVSIVSGVATAAGDVVLGTGRAVVGLPVVLTQVPVGTPAASRGPGASTMLRSDYGAGARFVRLGPDGSVTVLSKGFESACEPDVTFDGTQVLFAGRRAAGDPWNVFEMTIASGDVRQVTRDLGDCRSPVYLSTFFTITESEPWLQIGFVSTRAGWRNEAGGAPASHLYTCKPDGSSVRRITYNLSSDYDPAITTDGRLLYATWRRATLDDGPLGRVALEGINVDGSDRALMAPDGGPRVRHMPCITTTGLVIFVTADTAPWDGSGALASVEWRRPLHTYKVLTGPHAGLFHSPAALPDGWVLVSRRPTDGSGTHGLFVLDVAANRLEPLFDDPRYHDIEAKAVVTRPVPDGRSSVVSEQDTHAEFYCLDLYETDLKDPSWLPRGSVKAVRVVEGVPSRGGTASRPATSAPPLSARRILGEVPVKDDGSFHLVVPANTPVQFQVLDDRGLALRSCGWVWARSHQAQGCIGCHEDPERTPDNRVPQALYEPGVPVDVKDDKKITADFRRDVAPIIASRCMPCHGPGGSEPRLPEIKPGVSDTAREVYETLTATDAGSGLAVGKYVHAGRARTSPLVWHVLGRNTARPWDGPAAARLARPISQSDGRHPVLDDREIRAIIRWIDLGAAWDARSAGPSAGDSK